jgi:single-strand DNA-binding protein
MNDVRITISGNCADAPEVRFMPDGKPTARVRVAVADRFQNKSGEWVDGPVSWYTVLAWGPLAEHLVETFRKGDRVLVHGRQAQREYATEAGEKRTIWELTAEDIGPSLRYATASISRVSRAVPAQPQG